MSKTITSSEKQTKTRRSFLKGAFSAAAVATVTTATSSSVFASN